MIAFKFLAAGTQGRFSRHAWPAPSPDAPGAWVEVAQPLQPCACGIHACRDRDLPYWLDDELWRIELEGELLLGKTMVVAQRGRLLSRVESWTAALRGEFADFCLQRTRTLAGAAGPQQERAQKMAADVAHFVGLGEVATAAYVSAVAAHCGSSEAPELAYDSERAVQSGWLAAKLA